MIEKQVSISEEDRIQLIPKIFSSFRFQNCCLQSAARGFEKILSYCHYLTNIEENHDCLEKQERHAQHDNSINISSRLSETERIKVLLTKQKQKYISTISQTDSWRMRRRRVLNPMIPYTGNWAADAYEVMRFDYYNTMMTCCDESLFV